MINVGVELLIMLAKRRLHVQTEKYAEKFIKAWCRYLLYACLLDNPKAEVLFGSTYASTFLSDELKKLMGGKYGVGGGSLW